MTTRKKQIVKNPFEMYQSVLREWATEVPPDMQDEPPREKLLDAMMRLFEKLEAGKLRAPLNKEMMLQSASWQNIKRYYPPLHKAMCWQWLALNIPTAQVLTPLVTHFLAAAALRWLIIWLRDASQGQERLMAVLDRDLGHLEMARQKFNALKAKS